MRAKSDFSCSHSVVVLLYRAARVSQLVRGERPIQLECAGEAKLELAT